MPLAQGGLDVAMPRRTHAASASCERRDVSLADFPATSIAQETIHTPGQVPAAFEQGQR
jgi:uncharacterized lipoprotein YbaY